VRRSVTRRARHVQPSTRSTGAGTLHLALGLLLAAAVIAYANSLNGPFIFDDPPAIARNDTIRDLTSVRVLAPPRETAVAARPIPNLSLAVNYAISGLDVTGYHVANVAVHLACALLLFGIVRRTLTGPRLTDSESATATPVALVAALLWIVHPLQTEAVDYIVQRTESLMALFFLATLYCAIRAHRSHRATARWGFVAVLACAAGMACKESMVMAPLVVLLYDWAFEFDTLADALRSRWRFYGALAATWTILALLISTGARTTVSLTGRVSPWVYLLNQIEMITTYLRLTVWPSALVADYGTPKILSFGEVLPAAILVVALLVTAAIALVRWPRVGFLCAVFFLTLAPTSSIVPITSEVGAERRMYLPLAAIAVLGSLAGRRLVDWSAARIGKQRAASIGIAITALVAIALAARTLHRHQDYANPLVLWQNTVDQRPGGRARALLGGELLTAGRREDAIRQFREATLDFPPAHAALGTELYADAKYDEAIAELVQFVTQTPDPLNTIPARQLMARALIAQGKRAEAVAELQHVLDIIPSNPDAHGFLADALFSERRYNDAIPHYRALLASQPNIPIALTNLAVSLDSVGRFDEAVDAFRRVVALNPGSAGAHRNLARGLLGKGDAPGAELEAREAVRLVPADPAAHVLLAAALASQRKLDEAIEQYQETLRLNPSDRDARDGLQRAQFAKNPQRTGANLK
jgi:tetratricopeptide (TPR) repeat protein